MQTYQSNLIEVVFIGTENQTKIINNNYRIHYFNPFKYYPSKSFTDIQNVENLYRSNDRPYKELLQSFYDTYKDVDVIVANWVNPFHPEWLFMNFPDAIKIYGCIDDPVTTYKRTAASIWAFDGAFYVSPGYDDCFYMDEILKAMGVPSFWWPMSYGRITNEHVMRVRESFKSKTKSIVYIGNLYGPKFERLVKFKKAFGKDFSIYGRWPLAGFGGMLLGPFRFFGKLGGSQKSCFFPYRVRSITEQEKEQIYLDSKICLNMHYSINRETGNMRMYECVYWGNMLLCDKAAQDAHERIFKPDIEAVYYDNIEDAMEKAAYFLNHDAEREKIALAGFERYCRDYDTDKQLLLFLDWCISLKKA